MITVQTDAATKTITVSGHANAAKNEQGHDLVCCAASTLAQAYYHAGIKMGIMMEMDTEHGYLTARPDLRMLGKASVTELFYGYAYGLQMLAENFPGNVRVTMN